MFREVTAVRRCPICGKPDWCCVVEKDGGMGQELIICKRSSGECNVEGTDGKRYVFLALTKMGNCVYEEYEQHMEDKKNRNKTYQFSRPNVQKQLVPVDIVEPRDNRYLNEVYRFMQDHLVLDDYHHEYLNGIGWPDELISYYKVVSFPENDDLRITYKNRYHSRNPYRRKLAGMMESEFGKGALRGVPGAYMDSDKWTFYGRSGILFPMNDMDGNVKRLRLRMDFRDQKAPVFRDSHGLYYVQSNVRYYISMKGIYTLSGEDRIYIKMKGKYRTLASFQQDEKAEKEGFFANALHQGCQSMNEYSLYTHPNDDTSIYIGTEGEPKGAFTNYKMSYPVLTSPGTSSYMLLTNPELLKRCRENGMKIFAIATDADKRRNEAVMKAELALISKLQTLEITVALMEWDEMYGKGIDDCLAGGHWPSIKPVL